MSDQVHVVLVNWNGMAFLKRCICSVLAQSYAHIRFTVIDNASADDSVAWIRLHFPAVEIVQLDGNLGFARAHNLGIESSSSEFYMPLNFDVILKHDFVEILVLAMRERPWAGSATGKLLQMDPRGQPTNIIDSTGHIIFKSRNAENRGAGEVDAGQYSQIEEVFGVSGTAPLYRRQMLEDICLDGDYYDGAYFAYWEDVDLDWRALHAGWRAIYSPAAVAYHYRSGGRSPFDIGVRLTFRNRYLTLIKNDHWAYLLRDFFPVLAYETHRWAQMVLDPNYRHLWNMIPPTWRALPEARRRRRQIHQRKKGAAPPSFHHFFLPVRLPNWRLFEALKATNRGSTLTYHLDLIKNLVPFRKPKPSGKVIAITGTGRCGTSFMAQVFHTAGFDPGGGYNPKMRAGWEYGPLVHVNNLVREDYPWVNCEDVTRLLPQWKDRMTAAIAGKIVVKDPRFSYLLELWLHADLICRVIHMVRSPEEVVASADTVFMRTKGKGQPSRDNTHRRIQYVIDSCERHGIPRTEIHFPEVVRKEGEDFEKVVVELQRLGLSRNQAVRAIRQTKDPSLVLHSPPSS